MILDVGCGKRKRGDIGIDYSHDSNADVLADGEYLPFINETFDKVVSVVVLEHSPNPLNFIKEQHRVLKKSGWIELVTDNAQYFRWSVLKFRGNRHQEFHSDHFMIFFPQNVVRLFERVGFEVRKVHYQIEKSTKLGFIFGLLAKFGLFRKECLYGRFRIEGQKPRALLRNGVCNIAKKRAKREMRKLKKKG